jgi:hypothetical protein
MTPLVAGPQNNSAVAHAAATGSATTKNNGSGGNSAGPRSSPRINFLLTALACKWLSPAKVARSLAKELNAGVRLP